MRILFFIIPFLLFPPLACAQTDVLHLTMAQEKRAVSIGEQLRCLVCQNENIDDSSSSLAIQLRQMIRQQVIAGLSNAQIKHYMVARYGVFILLKPPVNSTTLLLYASPFLAFLIGGGIFYLNFRSTKKPILPLTTSEQTRLDELLK